MSWRTVLIQNPASLRIKQRQLLIQNDTDQATIPLEDIAALVIDTPQVSLTSALLAALAENQAWVVTCNEQHMPNGVLLPYQPHHRQLQQLQLQLDWSQPFKKRCWQTIVQQKIKNQAAVLSGLGHGEPADLLRAHVTNVTSGDTTNREAVAAKVYWQTYGGLGFTRHGSGITSAALNYAYAVVRACLARELVVAGWQPCVGVHHESQLNPWNLADDLLEPFRPWVDRYLLELNLDDESNQLSPEDRQKLVAITLKTCLMGGESVGLLNACERLVQSLVRASRDKDPSCLELPTVEA
jgi:CRISPR-associated protein Cas1